MPETAWDIWLRLRERFGQHITLLDLYELTALQHGIDVTELSHEERDRLRACWRSIATPGWTPASQRGRRNDPIEVVDYDESWPASFERWRLRLAEALGDAALSIEHVGSTAVPELPAKPVIDVQVLVPSIDEEAAYVPQIESLGVPLHSRDAGHRYFRPGPGQPRDVQIHVHDVASTVARDRLLFRDRLREDAAARDAYAALKRQLAKRFGDDRVVYAEGKTAFILRVLDETAAGR